MVAGPTRKLLLQRGVRTLGARSKTRAAGPSRGDRELATPLLLIGPALGRVYNAHLPGLIINGPQDFPLFRWSVHLGGLTAMMIALWLWSRHRRHGQPWLVVAAVIMLQSLLFETIGFSRIWNAAYIAFGDISAPVHAIGAGMIAAAALWWGWRAVPARPASHAASAA